MSAATHSRTIGTRYLTGASRGRPQTSERSSASPPAIRQGLCGPTAAARAETAPCTRVSREHKGGGRIWSRTYPADMPCIEGGRMCPGAPDHEMMTEKHRKWTNDKRKRKHPITDSRERRREGDKETRVIGIERPYRRGQRCARAA